jgi:hypothetical protein
MTAIYLPGLRAAGWAEYGRKTAAEMIALVRDRARQQQAEAEAEAILAAADADFHVEGTYRGVHVHRDREVIQEGQRS